MTCIPFRKTALLVLAFTASTALVGNIADATGFGAGCQSNSACGVVVGEHVGALLLCNDECDASAWVLLCGARVIIGTGSGAGCWLPME